MTTCTFCDQPAISGDYIQPPMCTAHHDLVILISLLKSYDVPVDLPNLVHLAGYLYPRIKLASDQIAALMDPMEMAA